MNRRHRRKKNKMGGLFLTILCFALIFCFITSASSANEKETPYKNVFVKPGDSLWSIASDNADENTDIRRYIEQIKDFNNIDSACLAANTIIKVPKYK